MGEFADEAIDRLLSDDGTWYDAERTITCKRCGADELFWEEARGERNEKRWVLLECNGQIHVCPDAPSAAAADEFPIEPPNNEQSPTQNSAVRARSKIHDSSAKSRGPRALQPERRAALDTVPRKYDVPRKSGKRGKQHIRGRGNRSA